MASMRSLSLVIFSFDDLASSAKEHKKQRLKMVPVWATAWVTHAADIHTCTSCLKLGQGHTGSDCIPLTKLTDSHIHW